MVGFRGGGGGGGGARGPRPPLFSCIFEKFLTLSLTFGHKSSQNDVKQHRQFLRPPLSGFSGSAPGYGMVWYTMYIDHHSNETLRTMLVHSLT